MRIGLAYVGSTSKSITRSMQHPDTITWISMVNIEMKDVGKLFVKKKLLMTNF